MTNMKFFKYNDKASELILFPEIKERRATFSGNNKDVCFALLCAYIPQRYFEPAITIIKKEAKKIMGTEE